MGQLFKYQKSYSKLSVHIKIKTPSLCLGILRYINTFFRIKTESKLRNFCKEDHWLYAGRKFYFIGLLLECEQSAFLYTGEQNLFYL